MILSEYCLIALLYRRPSIANANKHNIIPIACSITLLSEVKCQEALAQRQLKHSIIISRCVALCSLFVQAKYSPANYVKYIEEGLNILKAEVSDPLRLLYALICIATMQLPRTFVNLVQILDVTQLKTLKGGLLCGIVKM